MNTALRRALSSGIGAAALIAGSLAAVPFAGATTVTATEFANPSFESPVIATPYENEATSVGAWQVTAGDVDLVSAPTYPVHDGNQALDLNGNVPGQIQQTFTVYPGLHYSVRYWVNTNGYTDWNIDVSSDSVSIANGNGSYSGGGAWQEWGPPDVVPTGTTMTVTLTSLGGTNGGVLLDDFAVTYTDPGPSVSDLAVAANGAKVHLTGTVANAAAGQGDVTGAQYQLSSGPWTGPWVAMGASDGTFDTASEGVYADIALPAHVGSYDVCVRGTDELGFTTDTPVCLTDAFTVNVVASGPIVANTHKSGTINSATDKGVPDFVVDSVAGMVGTVPVGYLNINYKALAPVHFLPGGTTAFVFYSQYGSVDLGGWHSDEVSPTSVQFLTGGFFDQYPRGGFWMNGAGADYSLPASTLSSWAPGVPFDRGYVTVWSAS
jgi:hypothetical protein